MAKRSLALQVEETLGKTQKPKGLTAGGDRAGGADISGRRFERLIPILDGFRRDGRRYWLCLCDCGNLKVIAAAKLKRGSVVSCGCFRRECVRARNLTHGNSIVGKVTAEYKTWKCMKSRCYDPRSISFKYYGARGVTVCKRWRDSFANFLADMGRKPTPKHSIDRKEVNGNYSPGNCKWSTSSEQNRNKRKRG